MNAQPQPFRPDPRLAAILLAQLLAYRHGGR